MTLTIQSLTPCATLAAAMIFAGQLQATAAQTQQSPAERQRQAIATLQSGAPPADKALACKKLAVCGTTDAVPALAPLLADEKLASWARIALEAIPGPAADDALGDAMGKLRGRLLIGVINSIGVRRDTKSFDKLVEKLKDSDPDVASAAAVALGRIGGAPGAKALEPLLAGAPPAVRPAVAEGCILCAEKFLAEGNHAGAAKLYDAVRNANVSKSKTVEATRGAILARRAEGVALLVEQLKSGDKAFFNIGLRTARELPGREVTQALLAEMERATPERQSYFLLVLADRGDAEALGAAIKLAQSGPQPQRLTAIGVLDRLNDPSAVPVLLSLAADRDEKLSQAAKTTLTRLPGAGVDAAVLALLKQGDENARRVGCELATQRHLTGAIPDLLKAAEDSNPVISVASLKALGEMGGAAEMPALLDILARARNTAPVENALSALGARLPRPATGNVLIQKALYGDLPDGPSADVTAKVAELVKGSTSVKASNANLGDTAGGRVKKLRVDYTVDGAPGSQTVAENETMTFPVSTVSPMFVDALSAALAKAPARAKSALLRVLAAAGGAKALAAVRAAMSDPDADLREAAFHALCQWSTPEALGDLKELAKNGADQKQQILATRGYIQLIGRADLPAQRKLESLQEAMTFIQRDDERKLALGALGGIKSPQAIKLIVPHLDNPALKEEACAAAMSVAENFRRGVPPVVAEAMTKVAQTTSNPELARQARAVAARVEKRAKKK